MAEIYLTAIIAILVWQLAQPMVKPARFYEYPSFMAAVFTAFVVPQAISLIRFPGAARPEAVEAVLLMTLLCILACILGYHAKANKWIVEHSTFALDENRLLMCAAFFVACGYFFGYQIGHMTDAQRGGYQWSGRVTIYQFFANLVFPGFAICLRRALMTNTTAAWAGTVISALVPFLSIVIYGRREPAVLFVFTVVMALYFQKRLVLPRVAIVAAILVPMIGIPATVQYRIAMKLRGMSAISDIDFIGNFQRYLSQPTVLELRNAAVMIDLTSKSGNYGLGRAYWDHLVFRFVPAQFVGRELKESMMFQPNARNVEQQFAAVGYKMTGGTTLTGMGDSFREFGYFGALFFALLAVIFKSLWEASRNPNAVFAQLLYMQTATAAMLSVTHQTVSYLPGLVYNLIFLGLAAAYSRQREPQSAPHALAPAVR